MITDPMPRSEQQTGPTGASYFGCFLRYPADFQYAQGALSQGETTPFTLR